MNWLKAEKGWLPVASIGLLLLLWYAAVLIPSKPIFPPPHIVLQYLVQDLQSWTIYLNLFVTLARILFAFVLAMAVAVPLGILLGFSRDAERFFGSWVIIGLMTPSLVFIILAYTAIGLNDVAAVIGAALAVVWVLTVNIRESAKAIDVKLIQMARSFKLTRKQVVFRVILPQLAAPLLASARFGLGLIWKMVLFVELLGRSNGIGYQIDYYYQLYDLGHVLA